MSRSSCISPNKSSVGIALRYGWTVVERLPGTLLRLEGLAVLVAALVLYFHADFGWLLLLVLCLAPDLSMLGYLLGPRAGALAYDVVNRIRDATEFKRRLIEIKTGVIDAGIPATAAGNRAITKTKTSGMIMNSARCVLSTVADM